MKTEEWRGNREARRDELQRRAKHIGRKREIDKTKGKTSKRGERESIAEKGRERAKWQKEDSGNHR